MIIVKKYVVRLIFNKLSVYICYLQFNILGATYVMCFNGGEIVICKIMQQVC